jgi:membrane protein
MGKKGSKFNAKEIIKFLKTDIWRLRLSDLPRPKSFLIKQLRVIVLALRGFDEDKCQLRASALTFFSLLSIVPVAAMLFGIAKGFGFERRLEAQLLANLAHQEEILRNVIEFARNLLENTQGGAVAGVGVIILIWTIMKVLGNIELSFNDIWGIKKSRSIGRKFSDYLSIMIICPVLFIMAGSLTVFVTTQIRQITQSTAILGNFSGTIFFMLKFLPFVSLWILFTFIYIFMPNTHVNFKSGLLAGIIAGTIYGLVQAAYIRFQVGVAKYNAIYGSFAALPLFLVWLQLSWLIVLFGAEISFAQQNVDTYEFEPDCLNASFSFKKLTAVCIIHRLLKDFEKGIKPLTAKEISYKLDIPIRLVRQILYELVEIGMVSEICSSDDKVSGYQPGRNIEDFTVYDVVSTLEHKGSEDIPIAKGGELDKIRTSLGKFIEEIKKSPHNLKLREI